MKPQSSPLSWPLGWPRTGFRLESRFIKPAKSTGAGMGGRRRRHTIDEARLILFGELENLGASEAILSTNLKLRLDGNPVVGQGNPLDPGVAIYFKLKGKPTVLACDKWMHVECNIYAIAKHVEALRGQERWGVGSIERAFTGYLALEEQTKPKWFETLGVKEHSSRAEIDSARKDLIRKYHPDGSAPDTAKFNEVGEAYRIAMQVTNP